MAAPFDDQAVIDLPEALTYNADGSPETWAVTTLDDQGAQTVFAGTLSLISRDVLVTVSRSAVTTRPAPGATLTDADGTVYVIVSALYRKLGYFWEILARTFNVPGGLTDTGTLARRDSDSESTAGLIDPDWTEYASDQPCRVIRDEQAADTSGETAVDTTLAARVIFAGFYEMRAGDRFTDDGDTDWTVESVEPYDPSLAATVFHVRQVV